MGPPIYILMSEGRRMKERKELVDLFFCME